MEEKKFKVGDSARSSLDVAGKLLHGGTIYTPNSAGIPESELRKYPFIVWLDEKPEAPKEETPKPVEKVKKAKPKR